MQFILGMGIVAAIFGPALLLAKLRVDIQLKPLTDRVAEVQKEMARLRRYN